MKKIIEIIAAAVIEVIGIPPTFIHRGDPVTDDWDLGALTSDGNWHTIDISAIVPSNATAILMRARFYAEMVDIQMFWRKYGYTNGPASAVLSVTIAGETHARDLILQVDENQKIDYNISPNMDEGTFTIAGWWL